MHDAKTIRDRVIHFILDQSDEKLDAANLRDETSLKDELDLSSMQALTLVMDLENELGVTVEDEELEGLKTVGDVVALIESKRSNS